MNELIEGGFDLHVHSSPDVLPRKMNDLELAERFKKAGLTGFCMKSHYFCTSERAELVNLSMPGFKAIGALTLNSSVGGLNPAAVEMAARSGAKIIWLPTCDSRYEQEHIFGSQPGSKKLPFWANIVLGLRADGVRCPTISLLRKDGRLRDEVYEIMEVIARHDIVLATGHISHEETFAVAREATGRGIKKLLITHATFPSTFYSVEEQQVLIDCGAMLEHCFTTYATGKVAFETIARQIREIGSEHVIISTDLGQVANVYPDEGMLDFSCRLLEAGFTKQEVKKMNRDNPLQLIG